MRNFSLFILALFLLIGCSPQRRISKKYTGEGREVLLKELGEPTRIEKKRDGIEVFEYAKETYIHETTIGTGKPTLDPRISPAFIKVEIRKFIIDSKGVIIKATYEKVYR